MLGGDLDDLLISDFKMASDSDSDSGPIIWRVDPDFPEADIRKCCVNIQKCTVSGEGDIPVVNLLLSPNLASNCDLPPVAGGSVPDSPSDDEPLLNISDTELLADLEGSDCVSLLTLSDTELLADFEGFGSLDLIDPVCQSDEYVSDNYQFRTRRTDMADKIEEFSDISDCSVNIGRCTSVSGEEHSEEEQSSYKEDRDLAAFMVESKKSKLLKVAPFWKSSKKRT